MERCYRSGDGPTRPGIRRRKKKFTDVRYLLFNYNFLVNRWVPLSEVYSSDLKKFGTTGYESFSPFHTI
jgi:hypothetical protein